jgi:hypothetical protein
VKKKLVDEFHLPIFPMPRPRRLETSPGQFVSATEYTVLKIRVAGASAGILDYDLNVGIEPSNGQEEDDGSHTLIPLGDNALTKVADACFKAGA